MRIIVVTKNISYEVALQQELQALDCEVFVTRNDRKDELLIGGATFFDCLFISETFSDKEFLEMYQKAITVYHTRVVRLMSEGETPPSPSKTEDDEQVSYVSRSFVDLRDFLAIVMEQLPRATGKAESLTKEAFIKLLSNQERLLFQSLDEKIIISRSELCLKIWGEEVSTSRKSQLSSMVKKINEKLDKHEYIDKRIRTYWNKGYVLQ